VPEDKLFNDSLGHWVIGSLHWLIDSLIHWVIGSVSHYVIELSNNSIS
jgi:hypothetical protein